MEAIFEYLIPAFIVLYFAFATVFAVLKRIATPKPPWPVEPAEERPGSDSRHGGVPEPAPVWRPLEGMERPAPIEAPAQPVAAGHAFEPSDRQRLVSLEEAGSALTREAPPLRMQQTGTAERRRLRQDALRRKLMSGGLRDAVLLAEVIGPPRALRPYAPPPLKK